MHARDFYVSTIHMTPREVGRHVRRIAIALRDGDTEFLASLPYLGKPKRRRVSRLSISTGTRKRIIARDGMCLACGSIDDLQVDHIKPVVFGGTNEESNLQTLCGACNRAKGPLPWARQRMVET